ncbi:hypothetical protein ACFCP7_16320 [Paenibacillus elgii]
MKQLSVFKSIKIVLLVSLLVVGLSSGVFVNGDVAKADEMSGTHTPGVINTLSLADIYRGDIFVVSNPGGNYGTYTHAMIAYNDTYYSGGSYYGTVIESTVGQDPNSINTTDMYKVKSAYDEATLLRMKSADASRILSRSEESEIAGKADFYRQNYNGPYSIRNGLLNTATWYCSKLVYRVAYDMGIDMGGSVKWGSLGLFVPDDLYASSKTALIRTTAGNGQVGFSAIKDQPVDKTLETKIINGEVELIKEQMIPLLKNRIEIEKKFMKDNNIDNPEHLKETKELVKSNLAAYKEQLQRVKSDQESLRYNNFIEPSFDIDKLIQEANQTVIE